MHNQKKYSRKKICFRNQVVHRGTTSTNNDLVEQNSNEHSHRQYDVLQENYDNESAPDSDDNPRPMSSDEFLMEEFDDGIIGNQSSNKASTYEHQVSSETSSSIESCTSESSTESEQDNEQVSSFDEMLYEDSDISIGATYLLILKFCIKYKLSRKAQNDLLHLIKVISPKDAAQKIPKSYGKLIAKTIPSLDKVEKQMICLTSNELLKSGICDNGHVQSTVQDIPYFYNIPLEPQLKMLLEGKDSVFHSIVLKFLFKKLFKNWLYLFSIPLVYSQKI